MTFEARDLTKELGGRVLYRGLCLRVARGSTLAIRGASGSGKSQLLRHICGLDPVSTTGLRQSGTITYRGRDQSDWNAFEWRTEICSVPQQVPRLEGTPKELAGRVAGLRAQRARAADEAAAVAAEFEISSELWERKWSLLSAGERQRALLAILLARRPGVLLLDEPTAALDPDSVRIVEERLRGLSCVWVTHSLRQAERVADEILTLPGKPDAD